MKILSTESHRDEDYIIDLCDKILGLKALRQHRFDFLRGDPKRNGKPGVRLPVDAFYDSKNLVIEYYEKQHYEDVVFFDKKEFITVSGVNRKEQRMIYDKRRQEILPKHNINVIILSYKDFNYNNKKRIIRNAEKDIKIISEKLKLYI